jgi:DNA repair ATPase RecN
MDEERLERLTYPEIKEIAEQGIEPNLTMHRKRQIIKENFSWFFINSDVYVPHIFQIIGEKLLNKITDSFNNRKRIDPEFDAKYDTLDDYINDEDNNLHVDEEVELIFAALADAMVSWGENSYEEEERPYQRRRPRRRTRRRRWNTPRHRPQRRSRNSLYMGGKKTLKKKH